ncbi:MULTISPECIES: TIGR02450 family Trp-rich protein [Motilimonas]|uniref:TIGR02450 family Trp-rich protein n=1 Tax=Motilimonas cestriensis TaxID=2742685 RepID=A0ABS8WAM8_9GAMM|nr:MULTISPECIES: TIGR02450 family Trp-rich protein [Motilimonas]MCE0555370.1 TIGR02450 family Trp-rich protein [Motilimonas sp. E26]MCE2594816.1 TIGR02450 family Trp-rich protein [Motilimonas cestriensis]MDO6527144.1 TIGR02450 family Trp-rich protein [Motilimonas sp. 1_MG-2023]
MNQVLAKKLLHSKWTKVTPENKEKHFAITEVAYDEDGKVIHCVTQAVYSANEYPINWRELKDSSIWRVGWV